MSGGRNFHARTGRSACPLTQPSQAGELPVRDRKAAPEAEPQGARADAEAWERYMASCTDYIKRQLIVYQNWPQRKWAPTGLREEKVFSDMNN